jgi:DNA gyrase subunit A
MSELESRDFPVNIEDIMHTAYLQYSLSVNVGRAIPDVRDGLKPVNRRILYAMHKLGLSKSHAYTKSAKVVGEVIGKYHPHGDSSVYDAMVRLAQDFSMRAPLVDGQGNFGSIDGDAAAAYRYTECRMERLGEELLTDIEKDTVDMQNTFDESSEEPMVLPARYPQLLVNGTTGIGVGMATSIPPHSLAEVIDATVCMLENPKASVDELMQHLPGPDFPTGATLHGKNEIKKFYATGRGVMRIRAKAQIIETDGKEQIIVTEIPYAVNKENMVKKIADLVNDKKINGISGLRDETSRRVGIRIVIDIKRGAMGQAVLNQLYSHTQLESVFGCIMLVVDHNRPRVLNLPQVLQAYIDHRFEVITRRSIFELKKAEARAHILSGLLKALDHIDEVVKIIRESKNKEAAGETLVARFEFSKEQVNAILDMRLHQLTGLAREDLSNEHADLLKEIDYLRSLLNSRELCLNVIKGELLEVKARHSDARRTIISASETDLTIADMIARHSCVITVSNTGYVKRVPADIYRTQHRGGVGKVGMSTRDEDFVEHLFNAHSHDIIFFITNRGFMHWLNVYEIPEATRESKGRAINNLIKLESNEMIRTMLSIKPEDIEDDSKCIIMISKNGYIKKTKLTEFRHLRKIGIRALTIESDDDLIAAEITSEGNEIVLSTAQGMACRFDESQVRPMGRTARGVKGINFKLENDTVVSMEVIRERIAGEEADESSEENEAAVPESVEEVDGVEEVIDGAGPELLVITSGGIGKRSFVSSYRKTKRNAKGVRNIRLLDNQLVVGAIQVSSDDEIMLTTESGKIQRFLVSEIRRVGRNSKGVKIMDLRGKDRITGAVKVVKVEIEQNDAETPLNDAEIAETVVVAEVDTSLVADTESNNEN